MIITGVSCCPGGAQPFGGGNYYTRGVPTPMRESKELEEVLAQGIWGSTPKKGGNSEEDFGRVENVQHIFNMQAASLSGFIDDPSRC